MTPDRGVLWVVVLVCAILVGTRCAEAADSVGLEGEDKTLVLRVVGPDGRVVSGAKVGTGVNIFENSEGHPPQTIRMWLRGPTRSWPFYSDATGQIVLKGEHAEYRHFYGLYEPRGWVGYRRIKEGCFGETVELRLEPACYVHGRLTSKEFEDLQHPLSETAVFLYDRLGTLMMYFVSQQGAYEFLLPQGQYRMESVGKGPDGVETERLTRRFEIAAGQREFDLGVTDLPATKLAGLLGKVAPELEQTEAWKSEPAPRLALLRGQVVVLEFWGSWCTPCLKTMPKLMDVYQEYADQGVVVIAVHDNSVASGAELEKKLVGIRQTFWGGRDLPFAVAIDKGEGRGTAHQAYGIERWPTTVVIDRDGKVAGSFSPWGDLQQQLPRFLTDSSGVIAPADPGVALLPR